MRIERRKRSLDRVRQLGSEIAEATSATGIEGRVCRESCTIKCPQCGSMTCQCMCSAHCPGAPQALSVDPEQHPIEAAIMPLVFEMKRLGMFQPCWSCEGHLRPDGSLWKLPRVWFYCNSMVHLRLLSDGLNRIENAAGLSTPWRIVVTFSDPDNPETTFSLEPALSHGGEISLSALQRDAAEIARSLQAIMPKEARTLQRDARKVLASNS
jgi:hypothetical protein